MHLGMIVVGTILVPRIVSFLHLYNSSNLFWKTYEHIGYLYFVGKIFKASSSVFHLRLRILQNKEFEPESVIGQKKRCSVDFRKKGTHKIKLAHIFLFVTVFLSPISGIKIPDNDDFRERTKSLMNLTEALLAVVRKGRTGNFFLLPRNKLMFEEINWNTVHN